jgi:hypothetical protein
MFYNTKLFILFINTILFLLYQNNISCLSEDDDNQTLIFVFKLFSNGIITPKTNKSFIDVLQQKWSNSSELTNIGIRQIYLLGINDHKNYSNFISDTFNPKEILINSSNISYTIQSAYAYLQGIYPPGTGQKFYNRNISKELFPNYKNIKNKSCFDNLINSINEENHSIQSGVNIAPIYIFDKYEFQIINNENCPNYIEIKNKNEEKNKEKFKNQIYEKFNEEGYGNLFREYFNKTEEFFQEPKNLMLYLNTYILDYLIKGNDTSLNFNDTDFEFDEFYELAMNLTHDYYLNFEYEEEKLYNIISSPILNSLVYYSDLRIEYFEEGNNNKTNSKRPKFVVFSREISDLYALKKYLNKKLNISIDSHTNFSSSINFEVYSNDTYIINILYDGKIVGQVEYQEFKDIIEILDKKKIEDFCNSKDNNNIDIKKIYTNYNIYLIWTFWIIITIGLLSIFLNIKSYNGLTNKIY